MCCALVLDRIWDNHDIDAVLDWIVLPFQASLSSFPNPQLKFGMLSLNRKK